MTATSVVYAGKITEAAKGEDDHALFISDDMDSPFAERFQEDLERHGRYVCVSYWITDEERTFDQLLENHVKIIIGAAQADYTQHYSEYTGYLWTDSECVVNGHNLLAELESHFDKYCRITVTFSQKPIAAAP